MSDTADVLDREHLVVAALRVIDAALDDTREVALWSLDAESTREVLIRFSRTTARLTGLEARLLTHADTTGAGTETGATSTATWLAHTTRRTRSETHKQTRLAASLTSHPATGAALDQGDVLPDQAKVITDTVDTLPEDPAVRAECEAHLIEQAAHFDAKALRILGRHVLDVIDPTAGETHEAALLAKEEADAAKATRLTLTRDGHDKVHGRFTLSELHAAMLEKALRAIAAPQHHRATHGAGTYDWERPTAERLGQAFIEYIEHYPTDQLPHTGGLTATVVVTMTLHSLTGALTAASLDTGDKITAGQARRLACEAGLIPAVLGTGSVVLDLGRKTRLHTASQRIAIGITQRHCQATGCDVPAAACHVHHTHPWSKGGPTDTTHAKLYCPRHHHLEHARTETIMRT